MAEPKASPLMRKRIADGEVSRGAPEHEELVSPRPSPSARELRQIFLERDHQRSTRPSSTSIITAAAVMGFVCEAIQKRLSAYGVLRAARSARPTASRSRTMPLAAGDERHRSGDLAAVNGGLEDGGEGGQGRSWDRRGDVLPRPALL